MSNDEFNRLLAALVEEGLSEEEFSRLEELLRDDSSLRANYHIQLQMHTLLLYGAHPVNKVEFEHDLAAEFAEYVRTQSERDEEFKQSLAQSTPSDDLSGPDSSEAASAALSVNPLLISSSISDANSQPIPLFDASSSPLSSLSSPGSGGSSLPTSTWGMTFGVLMLGVLLGLFSGYVLLKSDQSGPVAAAPPKENRSSPSTVAVLTSTTGCDLAGGQSLRGWSIGDEIRPGDEIILREGIAEFRLASNGISLSIEGPASFVIPSPNSLVLHQGKLTSHVPWQASDFRLVAGSCPLRAVDAEFGVQVKGNSTTVHVFVGEVEATPSPFSTNNEPGMDPAEIDSDDEMENSMVVVKADQAVEFSSNSMGDVSVRNFAADRNQFASKISMSGRLPVTSRYVQAVKNSKPYGYWRFESSANGQIANEVEGGTEIKLTGPVSLPGDDKNHYLDLGQAYSRGNLVSAAKMDALSKDDYSVELWAKPSHFHRGFLVAFSEQVPPEFVIENDRQIGFGQNRLEKNSFALELLANYSQSHPGTIHASNRYPILVTTHKCYSNELYLIRRWQHIVVVKGKSSMVMYLNGNPVAQSGVSNKKMVPGMHMVIGRPFPSFSNYQFVGQLDELSVYDRALTPKEILEHYDAVHNEIKTKPDL